MSPSTSSFGVLDSPTDEQIANWGLPIAAITDIATKDEEYISGVMSPTLAGYSSVILS